MPLSFGKRKVKEVAHEAEKSIGLDVGVSKPYTTSDGRHYDLPQKLRLYLRRLKRHQNAMSRNGTPLFGESVGTAKQIPAKRRKFALKPNTKRAVTAT